MHPSRVYEHRQVDANGLVTTEASGAADRVGGSLGREGFGMVNEKDNTVVGCLKVYFVSKGSNFGAGRYSGRRKD